MEAQKSVLKLFDTDFQGLDYKSSDLKKDVSSMRVAQNVQFGESEGIASRGGSQIYGHLGLVFGIYNYSYLNRLTGATMQELLGFGGHIFKFNNRSIVLGANRSYIHYYDDVNDRYTLSILNTATQAILCTLNYTTSAYNSGADIYTLQAFLTANGIAYTADIKSTVVISGNQNFVIGVNRVINCSYVNVDIGDFINGYNHADGVLRSYRITAKTVNTITIAANENPLSVLDGQVWGVGAGLISSIPYTGDDAYVSTTMPYYFWDDISIARDSLSDGMFSSAINLYNPLTEDNWHPVKPITFNNKCMFTIFDAEISSSTTGSIGAEIPISSKGKPFVYDGQNCYRLGVPSVEDYSSLAGVTQSIAPSVANGRWRYKTTLVLLDAQDVEWESNASAEMSNNTGGTGAGTTLTFPILQIGSNQEVCGFNFGGAKSNAVLQAGVNTITTAVGQHFFEVGDRACFIDNAGTLQTRKVTAIDRTVAATPTFTIDGTAVSVAANTPFSSGMFWKLYRTEEYGTIFYEVVKKPYDSITATSVTYVDTVLDSALGDAYIEPDLGEEHDLPAAVNLLCEHQGKMVGAASALEPNTIYWSGVDGEHYWPRAFNNVDVPSAIIGAIKAIGSDDDSNLAIFKSHGYYSLVGDLQERSINLQAVKEGDYGISSHSSLVKINGILVGVGPRGVMAVKGGTLDWQGFQNIAPAIRGNTSIDLERAVAINDYTQGHYFLYIPSANISTAPEDRLVLVYNYEEQKWTEWATSSSFDAACGLTIWNDKFLACSRRAVGGSSSQLTTNLGLPGGYSFGGGMIQFFNPKKDEATTDTFYYYSLVDLGAAISKKIFTSFDCLKDPSLLKLIQYVRVWQVPPTFQQGGVQVPVEPVPISQDITMSIYKNWKYATSTTIPSRNFVFDTSEIPYDGIILDDELARSVAIELVHTQKTKPLYISGFEIGYCLNNSGDSRRDV